jgi:hypothetical protein
MKTLMRAAIRCLLMFVVTAAPFSVRPAQAYTVTLQQMGSNVVATGSGAINLTGLNFSAPSGQLGALMNPIFGVIVTGTTAFANVDLYTGFSGPTSFGSGGLNFANIGSGDRVGIVGPFTGGFLFLPAGYVSGNALSDSSTYNSATFASLGVTPGTYVWTWGDGANQRFTLRIGAVPDGGTTVSLLGFALLGLVALRRRLT